MRGRTPVLLRKASAASPTASATYAAPPSVGEVLSSPGRPLDAETRAYMEPRLGHDFGKVRIHSDERAAESARSVGANAYTVGNEVVFDAGLYAPHTHAGRRLLAHELAHVVQQARAGHAVQFERLGMSEPEDAAEREADAASAKVAGGESVRISAAAGPLLRRDVNKNFTAQHGQYEFEMVEDKQPQQAVPTGRRKVYIKFSPDAQGPKTSGKTIGFKQMAKVIFMKPGTSDPDPAMTWGKSKPQDADLEKMRTTQGDKTHVTKDGDTLASLSRQYYGDESMGWKIYAANEKVLYIPPKIIPRGGMDESPRQDYNAPSGGRLSTPDDSYPIPAGKTLTIPEAVVGGYALDIDPTQSKPRTSSSDPNVSPAYPNTMRKGENPAAGSPSDASMEDFPGAAYHRASFEFETAAYAEDLGITYGSIRWGFKYSPIAAWDEYANFAPGVSETLRSAEVEHTKFYKNKHKVQAGDTLNTVSTMYFGDNAKAGDIFTANKGVLTNPDADAALTPGLELSIPGVSA